MAAGSTHVSRRLLIALLVFGLFVLFDLVLFGWLIFRSLSEREVEKILLETRDDAEAVARQIAARAEQEGGDLYTAIALEHETQTFIDSVLREREIVLTVEIRAADGTLVFRSSKNTTIPVRGDEAPAEPPRGRSPELPTLSGSETPGVGNVTRDERERVFGDSIEDIEVPIAELGSIQIGISPEELDQRVSVLRRELVAQTSVVGLVTLLLLIGGSLAFWFLFRRARRLEAQAAEAERMAYIGTLASGLAHEIRNPLNSLNLNMQMLQEEVRSDGAGREETGSRLLTITRSEISRLERLVTDFLAYAKPRPLDLEPVPAGELLERVATLLGPEARRRGARIEVDASSRGTLLRADPSQIKQLLLNLAQNSLAAIEETGRFGTLTLAARPAGSSVVLEVRDDGVGIPEEGRSKIFDLFYSTRKGGTGLGLAIAQRIVRDHGGRIELESTPGVGTTLSVTLPAETSRDLPAHEPIQADGHA